MFIAHGEWLRKYAPWILAGVLVLLLPGFVLLFSPTASVKAQRAGLPTIRGKPVNFAEFQNMRSIVQAGMTLSKGRQPSHTLVLEDQINIGAVQRLILMEKAREFGIQASDDEVLQQIRSQPIMLNEQHQFDPRNLERFLMSLNNIGISESQYAEVVRQEIILSRLREMVGAGAKATPAELQLTYTPLHEHTTVDYVVFDADDHKESFDIKDEEARAFCEQNKEKFRAPAMVKVRYVYFTISDARKSVKLGDDEIAEYYDRNSSRYVGADKKPKPLADVKDEVKKDLLDLRAERLSGDRATGFSVKLVREPGAALPDFQKIAGDSGLIVKETEYFDLRSQVKDVDAGLQFNQAAFSLSPEVPFSDPVRGEDGYYVLQYLASKPSEIPPFEQVKDQVITRIKRQRAYEATVKQGRELDTKVKDAVAAGKSFAETCASLGLATKTSPPFAFAGETTNFPYASQVKEIVLGMATNAVSDFIPTAKGGLFFHLKQRTPPDPSEIEKDGKQFELQVLQQNRESLFEDWVNSVFRAAQIGYKPKAPQSQPESPTEEAEPAEQPASTS